MKILNKGRLIYRIISKETKSWEQEFDGMKDELKDEINGQEQRKINAKREH